MKELRWIYKERILKEDPEGLEKVQAVFDDRMDWSRPFDYEDLLWQAGNCYLLGVIHGKQQERARRRRGGRRLEPGKIGRIEHSKVLEAVVDFQRKHAGTIPLYSVCDEARESVYLWEPARRQLVIFSCDVAGVRRVRTTWEELEKVKAKWEELQMECAVLYPAELTKAVAKLEKDGGRLLLIDKGEGAEAVTYTAFVELEGGRIIATVAADKLKDGYVITTTYASRATLSKALEL